MLGWVSLATDAATEMIYPLLPLFLTRVLQAGAVSLGIIEGVAEAANSALKIASGRVSDRRGIERRLVIAGYALSSAMRPLIGLVGSWSQLLALRFADRLGKGIRGAPRDAMLARLADRESRGRVFGFHRAMDHTGAIIGPLIASLFLYVYPGQYRLLFALALVPGAIAVGLLCLLPPDPPRPAGLEIPGHRTGARIGSWGSLPRPLATVLLVIFLFTLGNSSDAFLLLRLSDLGVPAFWIPLLWSLLHVVKAGTSTIGGMLSDRWGRRTLIAAGWSVFAVIYAGFAATDAIAPTVALFLTYGLYFGLSEGAEKALVADLAPAALRGTAFGWYNAALGLGALGASLLFGLIWTRVSPAAAFSVGAGLAAISTLLLVVVVPSHRRPSHPASH